MVKTYIPEEIVTRYNKGKGIDQKEWEWITQKKKMPEWMRIPAGTGEMTPLDEMGDAGAADFSDVAPPFSSQSLIPPIGQDLPAPPMSPPTLPTAAAPPMPVALGGM